jgi:hypothetical protein
MDLNDIRQAMLALDTADLNDISADFLLNEIIDLDHEL